MKKPKSKTKIKSFSLSTKWIVLAVVVLVLGLILKMGNSKKNNPDLSNVNHEISNNNPEPTPINEIFQEIVDNSRLSELKKGISYTIPDGWKEDAIFVTNNNGKVSYIKITSPEYNGDDNTFWSDIKGVKISINREADFNWEEYRDETKFPSSGVYGSTYPESILELTIDGKRAITSTSSLDGINKSYTIEDGNSAWGIAIFYSLQEEYDKNQSEIQAFLDSIRFTN